MPVTVVGVIVRACVFLWVYDHYGAALGKYPGSLTMAIWKYTQSGEILAALLHMHVAYEWQTNVFYNC